MVYDFSFHCTVAGSKVSSHELVKAITSACFNARPPQPRYVFTWDVDQVLKYIKNLGKNSDLSNRLLSHKLVLLLALASAGRSLNLAALDVNYMRSTSEGIHFALAKLTKSRERGQALKTLFFQPFLNDSKLCVVNAIESYLEVSNPCRKRGDLIETSCYSAILNPMPQWFLAPLLGG